jgi:phage-related protein
MELQSGASATAKPESYLVHDPKGLGVILKGLVTVVFATFPNIAKKINSKTDKAVNVAVVAVNTAADYLKKGVEAVLDFLANTLDKLLGLIQSIYNGIFTVIGMIIRGEFKELMERIGNLVDAAKAMPSHLEGAIWEQLLGVDISRPMPGEV